MSRPSLSWGRLIRAKADRTWARVTCDRARRGEEPPGRAVDEVASLITFALAAGATLAGLAFAFAVRSVWPRLAAELLEVTWEVLAE